jgi:hypothetical protein
MKRLVSTQYCLKRQSHENRKNVLPHRFLLIGGPDGPASSVSLNRDLLLLSNQREAKKNKKQKHLNTDIQFGGENG